LTLASLGRRAPEADDVGYCSRQGEHGHNMTLPTKKRVHEEEQSHNMEVAHKFATLVEKILSKPGVK
jgi:hypothetical protein